MVEKQNLLFEGRKLLRRQLRGNFRIVLSEISNIADVFFLLHSSLTATVTEICKGIENLKVSDEIFFFNLIMPISSYVLLTKTIPLREAT